MSTAAVLGADPLSRARDAIGLALGVVAPEAVVLDDGSIRLRNSRGRLSRTTMRRLDQRLARRAATDITGERLMVEATALVGAEIDRARGGTPADGAAQALDALLDVEELSGSMRAETQAMLLTVLEGEPLLTESALQRLMAARAQARAEGRAPLVADTVEAARSITRTTQLAAHRPQPQSRPQPRSRAQSRPQSDPLPQPQPRSYARSRPQPHPQSHPQPQPRSRAQSQSARVVEAGSASRGFLGRLWAVLGGRRWSALSERRRARARRVQAEYDEQRRLSNEQRELRLGVQVIAPERAESASAPTAQPRQQSRQHNAGSESAPAPVARPAERARRQNTQPESASAAQLREQVRRQIAGLESAAADRIARADAWSETADAATQDADEAELAAEVELAFKDDGAAERARRLHIRAASSRATAERHTTIAAACTAAARKADEARDAYQALLTELDAGGRAPEVAVLAQTAADTVGAYKAAAEAALPSKDVLHNALPSGRLPHLTALCRDLNKALANKSPYVFTPDFLHRTLRAATRRVLSPDGFVLTIGNPRADIDDLIQIEFRLDPGELREVLDSPVTFDEAQLGQVVQAGFTATTAVTDAVTATAGANLQTALAAFPDSSQLKAAAQVVSPGLEFAIGRSHTVSGGATEFGQQGTVEALRGDIPRYRSTHPRWSWRLRTSATGEWSPAQVVDSGRRHDAATLELGFSHSYSVGPPAETVSLDTLGLQAERRTAMPEHFAARVDGLNDLCDEAVDSLRQRLGSLDRTGYDQLRGLLIDDAMIRLDDSTRPGGIGRLITNGGRAVAYAQLETVAVPESAELLSDSSPDHKIEQWRIGFQGVSGSQTFGASNTVTATLGYPGTALSDLGTSPVDLGPGFRAGRNTGRESGTTTSDLGTRWSTHRLAPTLGVKMRMQHRLTIHRLDRDDSFSIHGEGDAFLRMLEQDAFRYGLPVPAAALVRDQDGNPRRGVDGRLLLRGDPQPTDDVLKLPVWLGNGPGQLRGAGPAMIRDFQGADPALRKLLDHLVDQEMVPPLDSDGRPMLPELTGKDPALVASQLANFEHVCQQVTKHRLESGYDHAPQTGLLFELTKHETGAVPQVHSYRIAVEQHFDRATPLGISKNDMVVNGDMGWNTTTRIGGRSKSLPWSARLGLSNRPGQGEAGTTPEIGPRYARNALGRFFGWASGSSAYRMSITETRGEVAVFDIPHTIRVSEVTAAGDVEQLAEHTGSAQVGFDRQFCDQGRPPAVSIAGQVDPDLLQTASIQHVDARDPVSRLVAAVPELGRGDSTALHHLTAFLGVRNLVSRPEHLTAEHRTGLVLHSAEDGGLTPRRSSLHVATRVENLKYVGSGPAVIADLNMTTGDTSSTTGVSTGRTAAISGGSGVAGADGSSYGGSLGVSRTASTSASGTDIASAGVERTLMRDGEHYQFWGDLVLEAELRTSGAEPRKIELDNGAVVLTLPERDALRSYGQGKLDLPLEKVSDAVERLLDGNLSLPRRTTTALMRRYRIEKAGATEGLAATHTDERLADKVREVANLVTREKFDEVLAKAEEIVRQRVEVQLPRHYQTTLGAALIERTSLQDLDGNDTDLLREVYAAIDQHSPTALDDPVLATGLRGDLGGVRWRGHVDDMLDPGGFVREYTVGPPDAPRDLKVRIRLAFEGPVTTDGTPDEGANENAFNIMQLWNFRGQRRSATTGTSYGGSIGASATDGQSLSAGMSQDRGTSTTATSGELNTRVSEAFWLDTKRVERDYRVIVEIEETPAPASGRPARTGNLALPTPARTAGRALPKPTRYESTGRMSMLVPASVVNSAPEKQTPEVTDHRPIQLPADYIVEGTQAYVTGAEPANNLFAAVYRRLGRSDMLTSAGVRMHKTSLENMLGASARMAAFHELAGSGHELVPLAVPGHSARVVAVRVRAEISGLELISDPDDDTTVQIGANTRELRVSQLTSKSNRRQPTGRNVSGSDPGSGLTGGGSSSVQVTEAVTGTVGARHETGSYESSQVVTVKVNVDYHLDLERRTVDRQNTPRVDRTDTVRRAATGEAYLTMFRRDYDEMRARMEAGQPPLQGWDPSAAPKRVKAATVKVIADAQRPYQPMVEALARARRDGVKVQLTLRSPKGQKQVYVAAPDGTMTSRKHDDGFAAAFATLHPRLALLAEGRVDLRKLYDSSVQHGRFTGAVVEALQQQGIPAAALTETDSSLRPAQPAPGTGTDGAPQRSAAPGQSGAGMVID